MPTKRGKEGSFRCGMTAISSRETPLSDFLDSFSRQLGEYLAWHRGSGQLFQPVGDLIVVGLVCDEHVADGPEAGRLVKAAGADRNARCVNALPEQTRPASNAEATPRPLRGPVPLESAIF